MAGLAEIFVMLRGEWRLVALLAAMAPLAVHTHVKDQRGRCPDHEFLTPHALRLEPLAVAAWLV